MKKEKVVIFGLGSDFKIYRNSLCERYDIIGYSDNLGKCSDNSISDSYLEVCHITDMEFDKIIICTRRYYETIKYQLIYNYDIPESKIFPVHICAKEDVCQGENPVFHSVEQYKKLSENHTFSIKEENMWLICGDYYASAGIPNPHYFPQDIWGAKKIFKNRPENHYDIGSRLDGFVSHLLVFMEKVNYIDIRPLPYDIEGLSFVQADATNLDGIPDNSIESLSSFHAVEHFGLGRYGDPIDPDACFKAMKSLARVLKPGGHLYFGIPIGPENKLVFNAHRIFHPRTVLEGFTGLRLVDAAWIDNDSFSLNDTTSLTVKQLSAEEIRKETPEIRNNSCGLFEFVKVSV